MSYDALLIYHFESKIFLSLHQLLYKLNGGFDRDSIERLVNYAYTGCLEVPDPQVKAVFIASRRLKVGSFIEKTWSRCRKNNVKG